MKQNKNIFITSLAVLLAAVTLIGGTFAYLKSTTNEVVNTFNANQVTVELTETTQDYQIIPGTSQKKDPKVTVQATVPAYVYVTVKDKTVVNGKSLVEYRLGDGWLPLEGYENIYYREVAAADAAQEFYVLADNRVSYDAALENSDMVKADGTLQDGITLAFQAKAIQKEPFNNPVDAYEEKVLLNSTLTVDLTYSQETEPENPKFLEKTFVADNIKLFQTGALRSFYPSDKWWAGCQYTFTVKGKSNRDMNMAFDFSEKCGAGESYQGHLFEGGFGGLGDTFLLSGEYPDYSTGSQDGTFTLVGDYYPVVLTVKHIKGTQIDFNFTGSLTALAAQLSSNPYILKADTDYDEAFEITLSWPYQTVPTESCYVLKDGVKDEADLDASIAFMDRADTVIGDMDLLGDSGKTSGDLWADFEVALDPVSE